MLTTANRLPQILVLLTAASALVPLAPAQVPEGAAVVCTSTDKGADYLPGTPGLFIVHLPGSPLAGQVTPITGLPPELTTDHLGQARDGAMSVCVRSSDGAVIVGTLGDPWSPLTAGEVSLYVFHLNGSAVATTQKIVLGQATDMAYVWTAVAPDDRIFVAASQAGGPFSSGPMAGHLNAIVDPTSLPGQQFQLVPNPQNLPPAALGGAVFDPTGEFGYVVTSVFPGTLGSIFTGPSHAKLYRFVMATMTWCEIADWPGESAFGVTCDDDGSVCVSATNMTTGAHHIHTVTPDGCNPATVSSVQTFTAQAPLPGMPGELLAWGLAHDRANGLFVAPSYYNRPGFGGAHLNTLSLIDPASGFAWVAAPEPAGGWGTIGRQGHGVAVNNAVESYGAASPGANSYWFDNFPNPGGLPTPGNSSFSLTTKSAPAAPLVSVMALSLGRGALNVLGIELLIDPATAVVFTLPAPGSTNATFPFPIPNNPVLAGFELTAQSLHLESGGGWAASRGLAVTVH